MSLDFSQMSVDLESEFLDSDPAGLEDGCRQTEELRLENARTPDLFSPLLLSLEDFEAEEASPGEGGNIKQDAEGGQEEVGIGGVWHQKISGRYPDTEQIHLKEKGRFWTLHQEGKTPDERSIMYRLPDEKTKNWAVRGGRQEGTADYLTSSGGSGRSSNVIRMYRMERSMSGRLWDAGERKKDLSDRTSDRCHIRSGVKTLQRLHRKVTSLFLDIQAGFDNVDATTLRKMLLDKGTPTYMVD
ncbi:hypothetical protein B9Z19DRAFT_1139427 [Tuber borchii]|uniref:Uncharacterized protein n=1 Tax=Tuber borchii TaxID=42251 RepID=A0A2T6Z9M8_TUBBO|nr:hypothetical protein B9Z19DRAFT_1139427 [Tuber borchii]